MLHVSAFAVQAALLTHIYIYIYQFRDGASFSREADFGDFKVINFYRSQMQGIFIYVIIS